MKEERKRDNREWGGGAKEQKGSRARARGKTHADDRPSRPLIGRGKRAKGREEEIKESARHRRKRESGRLSEREESRGASRDSAEGEEEGEDRRRRWVLRTSRALLRGGSIRHRRVAISQGRSLEHAALSFGGPFT